MKQLLVLVVVIVISFVIADKMMIDPTVIPHYDVDTSEGPHYRTGQVLLPDYAHIDTLVVLDGEGLNIWMNEVQPATDGEISEALEELTVPMDYIRSDTAYYNPILRK